ncbi:hypothetical protein GCM10025734_05750 [Kitasatospora paranensis]
MDLTGRQGQHPRRRELPRDHPTLTRIVLVVEYYPAGFFEKTGNIWRAQGRRLRLDFKNFQRYVSLSNDEADGWRGEIRDGEVVKTHEEAVEEEEAAEQDGEDDQDEYDLDEYDLEGEEGEDAADEEEAPGDDDYDEEEEEYDSEDEYDDAPDGEDVEDDEPEDAAYEDEEEPEDSRR